MTDEKFVFINDVREKKTTARNAKYKRTHNGKGGAVKLPCDYMTRKEIEAMSGEVISYRLNDPMTWAEYKALPDDVKAVYIKALRERFGVSDTKIGKMFGVDQSTMSVEVRRIGLETGRGRKRLTEFNEEEWVVWCNGSIGIPDVVEEEVCTELPVIELEDAAKYACVPVPEIKALPAKDVITIARALGLIEGVACGVDERFATFLYTAVEMITEVVDREMAGVKYVAQQADTE